MNKKIIVSSLAVVVGLASFASVGAYQGEGSSEKFGMKYSQNQGKHERGHQMSQEMYDKVRALMMKYDKVEDFQAAKKALKEERKAEKESMRGKITKNTEKIENGVVITVTSDDEEVVEKLQNKKQRESRNTKVTKTVKNISNGIQITITSEDEDMVERIQSKGDRKGGRMKRQSNLRFQDRSSR